MKVLICVRNICFGGAEILECRLAVELNSRGVHTDILSQYDLKDFDLKTDALKWSKAGVPKIMWLKAKGIIGIFFSVFRLAKIIRFNRYDYVITTNSGFDMIASISKLICSFRHIVALHFYAHINVKKSLRLKVRQFLIAHSAYKMYAISQFVKDENLKSISYNSENINVIYNSINIEQLKDSSLHESERLLKDLKNDNIILFVGRIVQSKGLELVLKALSIIVKDIDAYLVILGDSYDKAIEEGGEGYKFKLIKLINELGLNDNVIFLGQRKNVFEIMQQCKILVHLPSNEGFGLVIVEAIAAGIPIIASNTGGIPEIISGTPYPIFDLEDIIGITNEIKKYLLLNEQERSYISNKAKNVLEYYTDERRSNEIIDKVLV